MMISYKNYDVVVGIHDNVTTKFLKSIVARKSTFLFGYLILNNILLVKRHISVTQISTIRSKNFFLQFSAFRVD